MTKKLTKLTSQFLRLGETKSNLDPVIAKKKYSFFVYFYHTFSPMEEIQIKCFLIENRNLLLFVICILVFLFGGIGNACDLLATAIFRNVAHEFQQCSHHLYVGKKIQNRCDPYNPMKGQSLHF